MSRMRNICLLDANTITDLKNLVYLYINGGIGGIEDDNIGFLKFTTYKYVY